MKESDPAREAKLVQETLKLLSIDPDFTGLEIGEATQALTTTPLENPKKPKPLVVIPEENRAITLARLENADLSPELAEKIRAKLTTTENSQDLTQAPNKAHSLRQYFESLSFDECMANISAVGVTGSTAFFTYSVLSHDLITTAVSFTGIIGSLIGVAYFTRDWKQN
jgi:hypothetical protein